MRPRLLLPLAVVALTLAWVGSASAISISLSFTDLVPGADIVVDGVPGLNGIPPLPIGVPVSVVTSPELATVTVGTQTATSTATSVGLREPGTSLLSDRVTLRVFSLNTLPVGFQVAFESDAETPLSGIGLIDETGLPQVALQSSLTVPIAGSIDLTVNLQSDLDNGGSAVPEPSTLLLFGSSLAGVGAVWRRYRHS
jgi:hypothetical protein